MTVHFTLPCVLLIIAGSASPGAAQQARKIGETLVDEQALTIRGSFGQRINGLSFQQDAVVTQRGTQYVAYYDARRHVCLARRRLPDGPWERLRLTDYEFKSNDAHNSISLGICPRDATIHLAFDHHGHPLHYRASKVGVAANPDQVAWTMKQFGPVTSELERGQPIRITYPRFLQTPGGGLQFFYRRGGSGNGDRMLVDYNPDNHTWVDTRQIDSRQGEFRDELGTSHSRCSYPNGYDYGPNGKLHVTWVWRESSQGSNHDLMYAYSEDQGKSWRNNAGELLREPPHVNSPGLTVVKIGRAYGLMNTHGQAVDSRGRVHVVMWHCTDETLAAAGSKPGEQRWGPPAARRYHHYWRDTDGVWHHREMPWLAGNRPKVFLDSDDNAYLIYGTRNESEKLADDVILLEGDLVIARASAKSKWTDWRVIHVERGPFLSDMLADRYRWQNENVLSVMVQDSPKEYHQPTPLRILDFKFQ